VKITIISNLYPPHVLGGYEILCANVVDHLKSFGHEVFVLTSTHGVTAPHPEDGISRGLRLYAPFRRTAQMERGRRKITYRHNYAVTTRHLKEFQPDIVFVWSQLRLTTGSAMAAQKLGIPVAFTMNDDHLKSFVPATAPTSLRKAIRCLLDATWDRRITLRNLDLSHVACISKNLKQSLLDRGVPIQNAEVIYQGIPLDRFRMKTGDSTQLHNPIRLLYSGQLHEYKGTHLALTALQQLNNNRPGAFSLTIAGTGPDHYVHHLQNLAKKLGIESLVSFKGKIPRDDMPSTYQEHDILLVTSLWEEPFGLTHLESMGSGTPVISTFRGGMKEFLVHGKMCLVFDPDVPDDLATKIQTLVEDQPLREKIIRNARAMIEEEYCVKRYSKHLEDFLKRALSS